MRMYDIIAKKRDGGCLSSEELHYFVEGFTRGEIPDYQASALMMAIYLRGMTAEETACLTLEMAHSGDMVDLSAVAGIKADKHSTGGVGDKTTLIVAPIVAACGVKVAKMSGRGLGHTGGTIDKLESIPGLSTALSKDAFLTQVDKIGLAVAGATGNIAPADKKLYALRDVTATVSCLPLIASSIMSKKLAAGSDCIVLDVKVGSGAFMKTPAQAIALAETMVAIGQHSGRRTSALVTNMDAPLGVAVGNALEVEEAVETLRGKGPEDLTELSLALAVQMLQVAGKGTRADCEQLARHALQSGTALQKLCDMVRAQGGDVDAMLSGALPKARCSQRLYAPSSGYLAAMDTERIGEAAVVLGAGRETKDSRIDPAAGLCVLCKTGQYVETGAPLALLMADSEALLREAGGIYLSALTFSKEPGVVNSLVEALVNERGVHRIS